MKTFSTNVGYYKPTFILTGISAQGRGTPYMVLMVMLIIIMPLGVNLSFNWNC